MQPTTAVDSNFTNGIVEFVASTSLGQYFNKKIDSMLWTLEKTAKYSVQENRKVDDKKNILVKRPMDRPLPFLVFWIVPINLHLFRIVFSKILVKFDKNPIESKVMVRTLQKWRRTLRSIRFSGHRKIREQRYGNKNANGDSVIASDPSTQPPSKKRHYDEMLDFEVLEDLLNRTIESDEMDSTFVAGTSEENSTTSSSYSSYEDHSDGSQSFGSNTKLPAAALEDTSPMVSISESEHPDPNASMKSDEVTFESIDNSDDLDATFRTSGAEGASTSSLNEERYSFSDTLPMQDTLSSLKSTDSIESTEPDSQPESSNSPNVEKGKEALNQHSDPTDALIAKLVNIQKGGKFNSRIYGKSQPGNKKNAKSYVRRNNSVSLSSQESLDRQEPIKKSKSQELLYSEKKD